MQLESRYNLAIVNLLIDMLAVVVDDDSREDILTISAFVNSDTGGYLIVNSKSGFECVVTPSENNLGLDAVQVFFGKLHAFELSTGFSRHANPKSATYDLSDFKSACDEIVSWLSCEE